MAKFIGVKMVEAWPEEKNGVAGYAVKYSDDYISWSPKNVFDSAYFEISEEDGSKLNENDINRFFANIEYKDLDSKTTLVSTEHITGFVQHDVSSCVDPKNYDKELGGKIALGKIKNKTWEFLGFVLQWAKFGIKPSTLE